MKRFSPRLRFHELEDRITPAPFTLVAMPDTQHYSEQAALNGIIHAQTQWIVDNRVSENIAFVMGLGDIVQHGSNADEWAVADAAFDRLDGDLLSNPDGIVPYSTPPGNHDYNVTGDQFSGVPLYTQHFGPSRFQARSWYGGSYRDTNSYFYFSAGAKQFLQIALEYEADDDVIDWARFVIRNNPGIPTILTTHSYLFDTSMSRRIDNQSANGSSGETLFRKLVYPNSQIFMVLNGHFNNTALSGGGGEYQQVSYNAAGLPVFEMLSDYQERGGQATGFMRLIRLDPDANQIQVKTYSPSQNLYETDADSQFTYSVDLNARFAAGTPDTVQLGYFQEGVDLGMGAYSGTQDTQLRQNTPSTSYSDDTADLLVDFPDATNASQALLRFDNIFGSAAGQVPVDARILSATLTVDSNNAGAGGRLHRMVADWAETATWNSLSGGVQNNGTEARTAYDTQTGYMALMPLVPNHDQVVINVTADVRAWAGGEANRGWAILPWASGTDGWAFAPSESATPSLRPKLRIEWLPAATDPNTRSLQFQQGVGGYSGAVDTDLAQAAPTVNNSANPILFTDTADADNASVSLLRFDSIFGTGANQIHSDETVESAYLYLTTPYSYTNAPGGGAAFHRMLQPWTATSTWATAFGGNGIQLDDVETSTLLDWNTGSVGFGVIRLDVTAAVRSWQAGQPNRGWALICNNTNGWQVSAADSEIAGDRPRLQVNVSADVNTGVPPHIQAVQINGGAEQRSRLTDIAITFSTQVFGPGFATPTASAFELKRTDGVVATPTLTIQTVNGRTLATLRDFAGLGSQVGSLADGRWTLRVKNTLTDISGRPLDGNSDGVGGDDYILAGNPSTNKLFRLFGDINGDGTVDGPNDFAAFGNVFGTTPGIGASGFDINNDGTISGPIDFALFGARFGVTI